MIRNLINQAIRQLLIGKANPPRISKADSYISYLRSRGCKVGSNVKIIGLSGIDDNHCWHISIGNDVTIAPGAYILAHDASTKILIGYTWVAPVTIEDGVFIGAHAIILPGVTLGAKSIVGAGAVVTSDVSPGAIVAGVPARVIGNIDEYQDFHRCRLSSFPVFDASFTIEHGISPEMRQSLIESVRQASGGYVE